jgi:alpha-ketoglutarate-dependent taurine dioxygenase
MSEKESQPLLDWLMKRGHRPEFACRFRWEKDTLALWDNRCVKQLASI